MKGCKICGISDLDTLNFIINHPYPPQFIGFICNYKKSSRYVEAEQLNELLKLDKKKSNFVAVLVRPDEAILEEIEKKEALDKYGSEGSGKNLPFSSLSEDLKKKEEDKE